jgi:hypothetical protein
MFNLKILIMVQIPEVINEALTAYYNKNMIGV